MFEFDYCKQFGESWQPRRNPFDTEYYQLILLGSEIPKWFNHQSVGNYISFWIYRYYPKFFCCVVFKSGSNETSYIDLQVSGKLNGIQLSVSSVAAIECPMDMTCNHIRFFMVFPRVEYSHLFVSQKYSNPFEENLVEFEFKSYSYKGLYHNILRCGVHVECFCHPPTSIPAFPICCCISNTVTPSPHLLNSCLELSNSNSMETTYTDSDTPLEGSHDDGCDLSLSLCTSPMGRNYPPPQPQATVPDDASHISVPSTIDLPNNMTDMFELRLGLPDLGIGSTASVDDESDFNLGSSSMAHNYLSDDESDFNLYPPSKKMRKS